MDLHHWESGPGPAVLCVHESAATGDVWRPLAEALGDRARTIAYDRRGWGRSEAPEPYGRTTVAEQAEDAARLLAALDVPRALLCGSGLGAVAALDLLVRRPELASGAVLIEPPLLAFVAAATQALSADARALRDAFELGGAGEAFEVYLSGALTAIGPGAERLPRAITTVARERSLTLFAELGAVPDWDLPLAELARQEAPVAVVVAPSTPSLVRTASETLVKRLASSTLHELGGGGPPHWDSSPELAELVAGML